MRRLAFCVFATVCLASAEMPCTVLRGTVANQRPPASSPLARANAPKITGMYSDMAFSRSTEDVGGMEVFIVLAIEGEVPSYVAWVQWASGSPRRPVLVDVKVVGPEVEFTIPESAAKAGTFRGRVVGDWLEGQFSGTEERIRLPRRISFWQQ